MSIEKIIFTADRPTQQLTLRWLPSAILCVPESQEVLYRKANPDAKLLVHPDSVKGLLPKRNWAQERIPDSFQLGDDVTRMQSCVTGQGEKVKQASGDLADALIDRLADEARDLGVFLFAFSSVAHPAGYDPMHPYRLKGLVYGQACGILGGGGLYWNENIKVAGDYWMSLLNAYHHRICLVDNRWATVTTKMFKGKGGLTAVRTTGAEEADTKFLRDTFGQDVIVERRGGPHLTNEKRGDWMRSIVLPY